MRVLGLDTSNYTTSVAVFDGEIGIQNGRLLSVAEGTLGLRQSEALFQHVKALPVLFSELEERRLLHDISAVGASTQPRAIEGSYMPCFLAGESTGRSNAALLNVPFYAFSHQQGHLAAAAWSAGRTEILDAPFLAWHLSGGTTELLHVQPDGCNVAATCIGGTTDISAGQLIDRTGVALGLSFPAGKALDQMSGGITAEEKPFSVKLNGLEFSLSGVENQVKKRIAQEKSPEQIACYTLDTVCDIVYRATRAAQQQCGALPVLFSGGVACNSRLRRRLEELGGLFAKPEHSADNAVGIAVLTHRMLERGSKDA